MLACPRRVSQPTRVFLSSRLIGVGRSRVRTTANCYVVIESRFRRGFPRVEFRTLPSSLSIPSWPVSTGPTRHLYAARAREQDPAYGSCAGVYGVSPSAGKQTSFSMRVLLLFRWTKTQRGQSLPRDLNAKVDISHGRFTRRIEPKRDNSPVPQPRTQGPVREDFS